MIGVRGFGFCFVLLVAIALPLARAGAQSKIHAGEDDASGLVPHFVSLRASEVNLRTGPGIRYPIDWVYNRPGMPLEVIDEFETWRRIRDWQGTVGWVHQSMLTGQRRALVVGAERLLRRAPNETADSVALVEPGVIARLLRCAEDWCKVEVQSLEGWLNKSEIFGVYPDEKLK